MDRQVDAAPRYRRRLVACAAVLGLGVAGLAVAPVAQRWAQGEHSIDASRLRTGAVSRGDLVSDVYVEGRLVAARNPTLFSVAPGIVTLEVRPGELVKRDQLLATIDSPALHSQLKQERATLQSLTSDFERQKIANRQQNLSNKQDAELARVNLQAAHRERKRAEQTFAEGITPEMEVARARDDAARAELELDHARQSLVQQTDSLRFELRDRKQRVERQQFVVDELERRLSALDIRSPVDGLVGELFVEDRDVIEERRPVLKVVDLSVFEINLEIPEAYADDVFVGADAEVKLGGAQAAGRITRVAPSVSDGRVAGTASFIGAQPDGLRQNQRAQVRIVLDLRPQAVKAPRGAYVDAGGRHVYVVRDGVAHRTAIELGARGVSEVEVLSGLQPGDEIVLSDLRQFKDAPTILLY